MKLVTFLRDGEPRAGALALNGVVDLALAAEHANLPLPASLQGLIDAGPQAWDRARAIIAMEVEEACVDDAQLLAPLPRPVRLRDASLFLEHMKIALAKQGKPMSEQFWRQVIYYNADHAHVVGPEAAVRWPAASDWIDYELEWACVVGRPGENVARASARDHIFGYTIFNDWSARDLQFPFMEAGLGPGAGKDFANSLGPCIVTTDEIADPYNLAMVARIDGELWSSGNTGSMHHRFEDAIAQLSVDRPLLAGEIIGSGTVVGGCGFELDRRLARGSIVELEVEGLGVLRNTVA